MLRIIRGYYKIFSKPTALWLLALLAFNHSAFAQDNAKPFRSKIAVVNIELILEKAVVIRNIKKDINIISEKIESDLTNQEIDLKRMELELIQNRDIWLKDDYEKKQNNFNERVNKVQKAAHQQKVALEKAYASAMKKVHNITLDIIRKLSSKYKFDIVLPYSHIMFVNSDLDITNDVVKALNSSVTTIDIPDQDFKFYKIIEGT
ncbi:MAG: hypothetical protein DGJ47_000395 [Rickettsiaceae bacterium]